ncbi:hypothetical protein Btru_025442 [Bulinus truncatus]|nr:hypothetical protein Btru_025442 [Bulinus truncatus]
MTIPRGATSKPDATSLLRRFYPDHTSGEIDLVITSKHDIATLDPCVPLSIKDKYYDPFFGVNKESTVDVDKLIESWDQSFLKNINMEEIELPHSIKPEMGSPHSVSDPLEIQIRESQIQEVSPLLPGEQDLPALDYENLLLLQHSSEEIFLSSEGSPSTVSRSPILEFTPGISNIPVEQLQKFDDIAVNISIFKVPPAIELTPVLPTPSPARKRKSGAVIVDEQCQLHRSEMRNNMQTSSDTLIPLTTSAPQERDLMKTTGSSIFDSTMMLPLWSKGCKFGILTYDTESDSSSFTSPLPKALKRKISPTASQDEDIPLSKRKRSLAFLTTSSIEQQRETSAVSAEGRDRSHSVVTQSSEESLTAISARLSKSATNIEAEISIVAEQSFLALPSLLEEHEPLLSPIEPFPPEDFVFGEEQVIRRTSSPSADLLKWYKRNKELSNDPITFKKLYPPGSTSRVLAAKMFMALCMQVALGNVQVFQKRPYGDIFITVVDAES